MAFTPRCWSGRVKPEPQGSGGGAGAVMVAMVTHQGPESAVAEALRLLDGSASLVEPPLVMQLLGE